MFNLHKAVRRMRFRKRIAILEKEIADIDEALDLNLHPATRSTLSVEFDRATEELHQVQKQLERLGE